MDVILAGVPAGSRRVESLGQAVPALQALPAWQGESRCRRKVLEALMRALVACADRVKMIARPGHARLGQMIGRRKSTVTAAIGWLLRHGVLGRVARGRSARFATPGPEGKRINEAAVYVLCQTPHLGLTKLLGRDGQAGGVGLEAALERGWQSVTGKAGEKNWHPSSSEDSLRCSWRETTHARETGTGELWPQNRPVRTSRQALAAARTLKHRVLALRSLSDRDVRSLIRPFLAAGWTPGDLVHALEHTPDQLHRMPSLGTGIDCARVRGHVRWRLAHWVDPQTGVMASASQQAQQRAEAARQALDASRAEAARARAAAAAVDAPARVSALESMREMFRRRRENRGELLNPTTSPA